MEGFNETEVTSWPHFVADYHRCWDTFAHPVKDAYETQVHRSINTIPFTLALSDNVYGPAAFDEGSAFSSDKISSEDSQVDRTKLIASGNALPAYLDGGTSSTKEDTRRKCTWHQKGSHIFPRAADLNWQNTADRFCIDRCWQNGCSDIQHDCIEEK